MAPLTLTRRAGANGVTATLEVAIEEVAVLAALREVTIPLPAGRWRVSASIRAMPEELAPPPAACRLEVTLAEPASVATEPLCLRLYRALDREGEVDFALDVARWDGGEWETYATTRDDPGEAVVLPRVDAPSRSPLWGAAMHIFIPFDRPPGSLDPFLDRVVAAGMQLVRTSIPWSYVCPSSPEPDAIAVAKCDAFFAGCRARGLRAIVDLGCHRPQWSSGGESWDAYSDCVAWCVDRYGDAIVAIETMNEPNMHPACFDAALTLAEVLALAAKRNGAEAYPPAAVVAAAAAAKRAICASRFPEIACIGPAIAGADAAYLQTLYDHGLADAVDAICCHPYGVRFEASPVRFQPPDVPWGDVAADGDHLVSGLSALRAVMRANGDDKRIWATEYGYSTSRTGPGGDHGPLDVTEDEQARWLAVSLRQAAALPYLDAFVVYLAYDNPWAGIDARYDEPQDDPTDWFANFGLVDRTNSRVKPAYESVAETIAALPPAGADST